MDEKRRHERVEFRVPVTCKPKNGAPVEGVIVDLSVGGVFIESTTTLPYGAQVTVEASLPAAANLSLPAVVRWTKPGGFGVQFQLLGALETHALAAVVSKSRPESRRG